MAWMIWGSQKTQETSLNIAIKGQWSFTISISLIDICLVLKKRFHQLGHGVSFIACHAQESLLHPFLRLYGWMDGWVVGGCWYVYVYVPCHATRDDATQYAMRYPPAWSKSVAPSSRSFSVAKSCWCDTACHKGVLAVLRNSWDELVISMVISMMFCWGLWWFMVSYAGLWWCIEIHADLLRFKAFKVSRYVAPLGLNMSRKYAHQRHVFFCFLANKILGKFVTPSHAFPRCLSWAGKPGVKLWPRRAPKKIDGWVWTWSKININQKRHDLTWLLNQKQHETASLNYSLQQYSPQHTSTTELPVHILSIFHQHLDGRRLSLGGRLVQRSQAFHGRTDGRGGPQQRQEENHGSHDLAA